MCVCVCVCAPTLDHGNTPTWRARPFSSYEPETNQGVGLAPPGHLVPAPHALAVVRSGSISVINDDDDDDMAPLIDFSSDMDVDTDKDTDIGTDGYTGGYIDTRQYSAQGCLIRSMDSSTDGVIVAVNQTGRDINMYWVDYNGEEVRREKQ